MPKETDDLDLDGVEQLDPADIETLPSEDEEPDDPDNRDDDGGPDDDGEGEGADEQHDDLAAEPPGDRQPGRRDRRIQALNERLKAAERERAETNRRLDELLKQRTVQERPLTEHVESEAQRTQRRSAMTPEERLSEDLRESEKRTSATLQNIQAANWDNSDRALYEAKASNDSLYRRWAPRVEQELQRLRTQGQGAPREAILQFLLGKAMLEQRGKGTGKQRRKAARRIQAQETRPSNSRGDVSEQRRASSGRKSLEERLSDVPL